MRKERKRLIFYENSKKRSKIIRSSFLRNKSLLAEIFFKVYYYFCMSFSVFLISSGMTFEIIGSPLRWPIIITATAIPIIVVVFEIIFKIKEHMDHFDSNPSVWIKTTDEFVYSFFRKIKRTGETIEVRYKTKFRANLPTSSGVCSNGSSSRSRLRSGATL